MLRFETEAAAGGYAAVCGVDEAGRGPLAGPVCAAAVILPQGVTIEGVNDSKQLTEAARERLFVVIKERAAAWGIGLASETEIDERNILQATFLAMRRAVAALGAEPGLLLVDGNRDPGVLFADGRLVPTRTIVHGDALSASIAAASILAKVTRDRLMTEMDAQWPGYGFAVHKGYPTKAHYDAVARLGVCPAHRRSFFAKRPWLLSDDPAARVSPKED